MRPVLLATVLAMLPIAVGWGEGGELQAPMARVVIGGLLSSSLITLLAIPIVCHISLLGPDGDRRSSQAFLGSCKKIS